MIKNFNDFERYYALTRRGQKVPFQKAMKILDLLYCEVGQDG